MSIACLLVLSMISVATVGSGAYKQPWREAAADVAMALMLPYPVVTYSYGAVAETLLTLYEPDAAGGMRLVTIRDGDLEQSLGNGLLPATGLTRAEIAEGALAEGLPKEDPANDLLWYLHYPRIGDATIEHTFADLGYERVLRRDYDAIHAPLYLDLFVRTGARPGVQLPVEAETVEWSFPMSDGPLATDTTNVSTMIAAPGAGVYFLSVALPAGSAGLRSPASLDCLSLSGTTIAIGASASRSASTPTLDGHLNRTAVLCPAGTTHLRVTAPAANDAEARLLDIEVRALPFEATGA